MKSKKQEVSLRIKRVQEIRRSNASGPIESMKHVLKPINPKHICFTCGELLSICEC